MQVFIPRNELKIVWNSVLSTEQSDNTLPLFGKANSNEFMSEQSSELLPNFPYKFLRVAQHYYMLSLTLFFSTPEWFTDDFINLFGYPC